MMIEHFNALPNNYTLLNGRYQILEVLGSGGFGITYLCFDNYLEKKVAIKEYMPCDFAIRQQGTTVLPKTSGEDKTNFDWGLKAFLQEARTLARFKHPQIIQVENFFEENHTAYLVMEYAEGQTLEAYLATHHSIAENELKAMLLALIEGLIQVHELGIFHRDIKPGNIIIRNDGSPVLIDFGAARQNIGSKSRPITTLITPGYAPMEQYDSSAQLLGAWTDIYALGALAFHCLTGNQPIDSPNRVMQRDPNADPITQTLKQLSGKVSANFLHALSASLAIYADQRPQSLQEWRLLFLSEAKTDNIPLQQTTQNHTPIQAIVNDDTHSPLLNSINRIRTEKPTYTEDINPDRTAKTQLADEPLSPVSENIAALNDYDSSATAVYKKYLHISAGWLLSIPILSFIIAGIFDEYIGLTLVFTISVLSACIIMWLRYRRLQTLFLSDNEIQLIKQQYWGTELANYWFGFSLIGTLLFALIFDGFSIRWFGLNDDNTGGCLGILLAISSAVFILFRHRNQLQGTEIALYWLGLSLSATILLGILFDESNSDLFDIGSFESGILLALLFSLMCGIFILYQRKRVLYGTEIALYWLGLSINLGWMILLFFMDSANQFPFFIILLLALLSAVAILIMRRKYVSFAELTFYWIGLTVVALLFASLSANISLLFICLLASLISGGVLLWKYKKASALTASR